MTPATAWGPGVLGPDGRVYHRRQKTAATHADEAAMSAGQSAYSAESAARLGVDLPPFAREALRLAQDATEAARVACEAAAESVRPFFPSERIEDPPPQVDQFGLFPPSGA